MIVYVTHSMIVYVTHPMIVNVTHDNAPISINGNAIGIIGCNGKLCEKH